MSTPKATARSPASPANSRQLRPPRKSTAIAIVVTTTSAPKSGSRSSSAAMNVITANIGRKPFLKSSMKAAFRTV